MDQTELDLQYSPSKWTKRMDPENVIPEHIRVVTQASQAAKEIVPCSTNLQYGPKNGQRLDIFGGNSLPRDVPMFVYVHGGYWQELSKDISSYCAETLTTAGIRVVVLGYDLAPAVTVGEIVEEITEAAEYVINLASDYGSKCVLFCGHSAGAHLVSMLPSTPWFQQLEDAKRDIVSGFCLISGIYDLTPIVDTYINDALHLTREDAKQLSPMLTSETCKNQKNLRVLIVIGQHDSPEFHRQSTEYANKLRSQNYNVDILIVPDVDHFNVVEKLQEGDYVLTHVITEMMTSVQHQLVIPFTCKP